MVRILYLNIQCHIWVRKVFDKLVNTRITDTGLINVWWDTMKYWGIWLASLHRHLHGDGKSLKFPLTMSNTQQDALKTISFFVGRGFKTNNPFRGLGVGIWSYKVSIEGDCEPLYFPNVSSSSPSWVCSALKTKRSWVLFKKSFSIFSSRTFCILGNKNSWWLARK